MAKTKTKAPKKQAKPAKPAKKRLKRGRLAIAGALLAIVIVLALIVSAVAPFFWQR